MKKLLVAVLLLFTVALSGCYLTFLLPRATPARTQAVYTPARPEATTAAPAPAPTEREKLTKKQLLAVFRGLAFASEYGDSGNQIRKWTKKMTVGVRGNPGADDRAALNRAIDWLNAVEGFPGISVSKGKYNVAIWFVPLAEMPDAVPGYVEGNWGFFMTSVVESGIDSATIAIATDVTQQEERNHLIFEELIQSTGLMQDQYDYDDSIFYGNWTTVQQPSWMDEELMRMLYQPRLRHGMNSEDAMSVLGKYYAPRD